MITLICIVLFALLNRARGTRLFNMTTSTTLGRVVACWGMAMVLAFADIEHGMAIITWAWPSLYLWTILGWDAYWSAEIGNDPDHSKVWGICGMTWRMALAAPCIIGLAVIADNYMGALYAAGTLLLWLPYLVIGAISKPHVIPWSEYIVGGCLGYMALKALGL